MMRITLFAVVVSAMMVPLATAASAQTQPAPAVSVANAWSRATTASATSGAIYATITDHGAPDTLLSVTTPVAGMAQVHQTIQNGDVMEMRPVDGLTVSADKPVTLAPGGYHIMLMGLKRPLVKGDSFPVTLRFAKAGSIEVIATVQSAGASAPAMDMGQGMSHSGMKMP
jgi:copper(I)-binding protein